MRELRDYQTALRDALLSGMAEGRAMLAVAPTGSGKTVVFSDLTRLYAEGGMTTLVLAHREELLAQAAEKIEAATGIVPGVIAGGTVPDLTRPVQVGSVATVARRLPWLMGLRFDLGIFDEAHHIISPSYMGIVESGLLKGVVGFTATPQRLDGSGLGREVGGVFDAMAQAPSTRWLTDQGFLSPAVTYAPSGAGPDMAGVKTQMGDFNSKTTGAIMRTPARIAEVVDNWQRRGDNRQTVAFCAGRQHAADLASAFRAAGVPAAMVDGTMGKQERRSALEALRSGAIHVLTSADLIGEGVDIPDVGCVILARPTQSLSLHLQQIGRGLRPAEGKTNVLIFDHAGNTFRHGFATDERDWSLDSLPRKKAGGGAAPVKPCPDCMALCGVNARECQHCGREFERKATLLSAKARDLVQIDAGQAVKWQPTKTGNRSAIIAGIRCVVAVNKFGGGYLGSVLSDEEQWVRVTPRALPTAEAAQAVTAAFAASLAG